MAKEFEIGFLGRIGIDGGFTKSVEVGEQGLWETFNSSPLAPTFRQISSKIQESFDLTS